MKRFLIALAIPGILAAQVWPEAIGEWRRIESAGAEVPQASRPLWDELGLKELTVASYGLAGKKFTASGYRLLDSTSALAAFDWQRPRNARPSAVAALAAETPTGLITAYGNYVLIFDGYKPAKAEFEAVAGQLRNVDTTPLPTLPKYLPTTNLVANSERYILGPVGLEQFYSGISPSVTGFHLAAEGQTGAYRTSKGEMSLLIVNYPTQQIAMAKIEDFQKLPGVVAKRSGPLIALVRNAPDPDEAQRLLAQIRFQAAVARSEHVVTMRDNIGNLIINAFILIGILVGMAVVAGLVVGGMRRMGGRGKQGQEADPMILLHLEKRS